MKKFKLNLNDLKVDSFETIQPESKTGTVKGFRPPPPSNNDPFCDSYFDITCRTCEGHTCGYSCGGTCDGRPTCEDTCQESCLGTCDVQCTF